MSLPGHFLRQIEEWDMKLPEMEDLVIFAIDTRKESKTRGKEVPGSLVKLMRLPKEMAARTTGRCSGPWQHIRGGFNTKFRLRDIGGSKRNVPRKVLEPVVAELVTTPGTKETHMEDMTLQPDSYPVKAEDTSGTLVGPDGRVGAVFTEDNYKYMEHACLFHFRHGSLAFLDDETSDAVYADELPKLKALVGKAVFWEFRPYVRTAAGGASGVDEYRMAIADATEEPLESK